MKTKIDIVVSVCRMWLIFELFSLMPYKYVFFSVFYILKFLDTCVYDIEYKRSMLPLSPKNETCRQASRTYSTLHYPLSKYTINSFLTIKAIYVNSLYCSISDLSINIFNSYQNKFNFSTICALCYHFFSSKVYLENNFFMPMLWQSTYCFKIEIGKVIN